MDALGLQVKWDGREIVPVAGNWIVGLLINLLVPVLVWGTVIAGLILVVREKVEEDDLNEERRHETWSNY
jgi:hypothetical protein